jgi:antitoxin HicB
VKFRIVVEEDEGGKFVSSCPTLPGCWSQGDTRDEAVRNIGEAIEGYLESLRKHGDPIPPPITEEVIDVTLGKAG